VVRSLCTLDLSAIPRVNGSAHAGPLRNDIVSGPRSRPPSTLLMLRTPISEGDRLHTAPVWSAVSLPPLRCRRDGKVINRLAWTVVETRDGSSSSAGNLTPTLERARSH